MYRQILISLTNSMQHSPSPAIKKNSFYWTSSFIIIFTMTHKFSPQPPILFVISSTHLCLGLQSHLFLPGFPTKTPYTFLFSPTHSTCQCISFYLIWLPGKYRSWSSSLRHLPPSLPLFSRSYTHTSAPYAWTSSAHILPLRCQAKFHDIKHCYCDVTKGSVMENPVTVCSALCPVPLHLQLTLFSSRSPCRLEFHPAPTTSLINTSLNFVLSPNSGERGCDDRYLVIITGKVNWHILLCHWVLPVCGPGSSVGIATGYELDGPGIESRWGLDFLHLSRPDLGTTQPPVQWVPGLSQG